MSVASPRQSISSAVRSPPSSRTSLENPQPAIQRSTNPRRNRAALRDYYNLKSAEQTDEAQNATPKAEDAEENELDKEGFDASTFVKSLLESRSLDGVLKIEGGLVSDIRGLDGERKALVYDNYSKLIAATDTIRKMRSNMEPLTPATSTLAPAISHIAETAAALSKESSNQNGQSQATKAKVKAQVDDEMDEKDAKVQTIRWVLDAPRRLSSMIASGQRDEAETEWAELERLLQKWDGVQGVEEVKKVCEEVMNEPETK